MISAKILLLSSMLLLVGACSTATAPPPGQPNAVAVRVGDPESQRLLREALQREQLEREAAEQKIADQPALREREIAEQQVLREREIAEQQALRERENTRLSEPGVQARVDVDPETEARRQQELQEYRQRNDREEAPQSNDQDQGPQSFRNAQDVERAEARVVELREQIAAYKSETAYLESTNSALREAIAAAEDLSRILAEEQQKYNNIDPATGQPVDVLAKARIEELKAQIERLKLQATALTQPTP